MLVTVLIAVLAALTVYAVSHTRTITAASVTIQPAPCAAEGALRVARQQLARGEIDLGDYIRIRGVLSG